MSGQSNALVDASVEGIADLDCRLLIDGAAGGPWNMAVDEVLLETTSSTGQAAARFYQWSEPTLSLGYFQRFDDRTAHPASSRLPAVRRSSGGGAIVHDRELTYCLTVPRTHLPARDADGLYRGVHGALLRVLAERGVSAGLHPACPSSKDEPFLCFQRRGCGDVIVSQAKIAGSAQRRSRGAVLQHGSILVDASAAAPELPGLRQLSNQDWAINELQSGLVIVFAEVLGLRLIPGTLTSEERRRAETLVTDRFGSGRWTVTRHG